METTGTSVRAEMTAPGPPPTPSLCRPGSVPHLVDVDVCVRSQCHQGHAREKHHVLLQSLTLAQKNRALRGVCCSPARGVGVGQVPEEQGIMTPTPTGGTPGAGSSTRLLSGLHGSICTDEGQTGRTAALKAKGH